MKVVYKESYESETLWINLRKLKEDGELEDMAKKLYHYVMEVASGKQVCSEKAGFHDMAIFKRGVTL